MHPLHMTFGSATTKNDSELELKIFEDGHGGNNALVSTTFHRLSHFFDVLQQCDDYRATLLWTRDRTSAKRNYLTAMRTGAGKF